MQSRGITRLPLLCLLLLCGVVFGQEKESAAKPQIAAPGKQSTETKPDVDPSRTLKLKGVLNDGEGAHLTGVVGVRFSIYEEQEGGTPLWQEVQNVDADRRGDFTILVGSSTKEGISPELYTTKQMLWLGVEALLPGQAEQPRMQLVSTPHRLIANSVTRLVIPRNAGLERTVEEAPEALEETFRSPEEPTAPTTRRSAKRRPHQP